MGIANTRHAWGNVIFDFESAKCIGELSMSRANVADCLTKGLVVLAIPVAILCVLLQAGLASTSGDPPFPHVTVGMFYICIASFGASMTTVLSRWKAQLRIGAALALIVFGILAVRGTGLRFFDQSALVRVGCFLGALLYGFGVGLLSFESKRIVRHCGRGLIIGVVALLTVYLLSAVARVAGTAEIALAGTAFGMSTMIWFLGRRLHKLALLGNAFLPWVALVPLACSVPDDSVNATMDLGFLMAAGPIVFIGGIELAGVFDHFMRIDNLESSESPPASSPEASATSP